MKRYILTFAVVFLSVVGCLAQKKAGDTVFIDLSKSLNEHNPELIQAGYERMYGRQNVGLRFKNNGDFKSQRSNYLWNAGQTTNLVWVEGDANVDVIATSIDSKKAGIFHYRMILDDNIFGSEWLPVKQFRKTKAGLEYAYLGNFNFKGRELRIQIERKDFYSIREELVIDNRPIKKPYINSFSLFRMKSPTHLEVFELSRKLYTKDSQGNYTKLYIKEYDQIKRDNAGTVTGFNYSDKILRLEAQVTPPPDTYKYQLYLIYYAKFKSDTIKIPTDLSSGFPLYVIDKSYFQKPGKYKAIIVPEFFGGKQFFDKSSSYSFEVFPLKSSWFTSKNIIIGLSTILLLFVGFFGFYFRKNKRKLAQETQRKERASLELKSIHAQLNPHFIFNALSSIQNLVNQQNIAKANEYLSTFSGLTRQILSNKDELISIVDELKMLEGYLKMEQLRFGFQYKISIDSTIDVINAEIPAMLLQPFVENAIKHGVGSKGEKGVVEVQIEKTNGDLVIQIKDNGEGFDELHIKESSMGIKLCKERIKLLNQLHADAPVEMNITSNENGTLIGLQLNGWA